MIPLTTPNGIQIHLSQYRQTDRQTDMGLAAGL